MQQPQTMHAPAPSPAFWPTVLGLGIAIVAGFFVLGLGFAAPIAYGVAVLAFWLAARTEHNPDWYGFYRGLTLGLGMWFVLSIIFVFGLTVRSDGGNDNASFSGPPHAVATSVPPGAVVP